MPRNKIMSTAEIAEATDWRKVPWSEIYDTYRHAVDDAVGNEYATGTNVSGEGDIDLHRRRIKGAKNALIVISGTHGAEGPAGSFVQMMMARDEFFLGLKDTQIIFIHALNPWGYENGRRTNIDNVDLNRNGGTEFITQSRYAGVHPLVMPKNWDDAAVENLRNVISAKNSSVRKDFWNGQCDFSNGIFYGGTEPSWSMEVLECICDVTFSGFEKVSVLDIHTGLGEFGKVTALSPATSPTDPLAIRTKSWRLTDIVEFPNIPKDENILPPVSGDVLSAMIRFLPNTEVTPIALEFGTMPLLEYFPYFVAENWIYHNPGRLAPEEERVIREKFWELFYPSENRVAWLDGIWAQTRTIAEQMILGMREA